MNMSIKEYSLFCTIVDFGKASKVLHASKELGATGGTILLGKGSVKSSILELLGLNEIRKEILLMAIENYMDEYIHNELSKRFSFDKPNHGIAFSIPLKSCFGVNQIKSLPKLKKEGENKVSYEAIFTIVDKGLADEVLAAAESAGSTGGTIIHGRGSGTHETARLFNIEIEPEKDIVLILADGINSENITNAIKEKLNLDKEGTGVIFTLDVARTTGLYNGKK